MHIIDAEAETNRTHAMKILRPPSRPPAPRLCVLKLELYKKCRMTQTLESITITSKHQHIFPTHPVLIPTHRVIDGQIPWGKVMR